MSLQISQYKNPEAFIELVKARRSIRVFSDEKIPDNIVDSCLDLALLAPNSSNLQTWRFYKIQNTQVREKLNKACFSQHAATTCAAMIVCVAEPCSWRKNAKQMLDIVRKSPDGSSAKMESYYGKIVPFVYTMGIFNIFTPIKWIMNAIVGLFRPVPREPISSFGLTTWAVKSCALACENLMLAFRAYGYDTCPMEGFDSKRVREALNLSCSSKIVMIIGAGRGAEGGLYGHQVRFPREQAVMTV